MSEGNMPKSWESEEWKVELKKEDAHERSMPVDEGEFNLNAPLGATTTISLLRRADCL
jgi:hypothetical protein